MFFYCSSAAVSESIAEKPLVVDESSEVLEKFQLEAIGIFCMYIRMPYIQDHSAEIPVVEP